MSLPPDQMIRLQTQLQREQRWRELSRASAQKSIQPLTSSVNPPFDDVSPAATSLDTLKTRLIRTISHEYRTPLTIISLAAESLAQNRTRLTVEQRQQCFRQIQQAMRRMTKLINDVLWISQAEAQEIEPHFSAIPLADFCERILEELTRLHPEWGDRLQAQVRTPFVAVPSDPFLLQQLVLQLLINALKYSEPEQPVTLELVIARAMLRIRVCDRGRGIPASECDRIYDCFYRAQNVESIAGTGLGLTIAKQCVDLLGGQIDCTSRLGQGSEFQVKLPLAVRHRRR
ncbi:MAG: HAMP domain-containing sensor histidine kinase [Cyanobacteria bacterium P01_G01_bin.54]